MRRKSRLQTAIPGSRLAEITNLGPAISDGLVIQRFTKQLETAKPMRMHRFR